MELCRYELFLFNKYVPTCGCRGSMNNIGIYILTLSELYSYCGKTSP